MLATWWLAIVGLPVFHQPLPEAPAEPSAVAVAAGQVSLRRPCYAVRCQDVDWQGPATPAPIARAAVPGTRPTIVPLRVPSIAARPYPLYSPASARDWRASQANHTRVETRVGYEAVRTPDTSLRMEFGTGYRIEPYADFGTAAPGPIARGNLQLSHAFGDDARLTQQVQVETGSVNTTVRQTLGVDVDLRPQWTLRSNVELRHDTAADGGRGHTDTEGSVRLHYGF